jgi:hypothetical protein
MEGEKRSKGRKGTELRIRDFMLNTDRFRKSIRKNKLN